MSAGSDAASQRINGEVFEDPIRFRGVSHWLSATQHWCWARRKDRNSGFWREYESQTRSDSDIESSQPKLRGTGLKFAGQNCSWSTPNRMAGVG